MDSAPYGLAPTVYQRYLVLKRWLVSAGYRVHIISGKRDVAEQLRLRMRWELGESPYPAARPGTSMHELGLAFDLAGSRGALHLAGQWAPYVGLRWGGGFSPPDPPHFELAR